MAIRILLILFSLFILVNIVITLVSVILGVNLYKRYGNKILKGYGIFILLIVVIYMVLALLGLN